LRIESRMRHRYRIHDEGAAAKSFDFKSEFLEVRSICFESIRFCRTKMQSQGKEKPLCGSAPGLERLHEFLIEHPLVRRMLVDEHESILMLERDVHAAKLEELRNWLRCPGLAPLLFGRVGLEQ